MNEDWGEEMMGIGKYASGGTLERGEQEPKIGWGALDVGGIPLGLCLGIFPPCVVCSLGLTQLPHLSLGLLVLGPMKS